MHIEWNTVTWYSKALAVVLFVGVAVGAFYLGREYERVMSDVIQSSQKEPAVGEEMLIHLAKNGPVFIDGNEVLLADGVSRVPQKESSAEVVTQYFGNEVFGDINQDGKGDLVFLITQNTGGTGTFFYVAALISQKSGYRDTDALFIGDRIAPQSTDIRDGVVNVNYADRAPNEPMTKQPSIGKTLRLVIKNGRLVKQ